MKQPKVNSTKIEKAPMGAFFYLYFLCSVLLKRNMHMSLRMIA